MKSAMSRFDTRLPESQKEFFEYAANLGGFRTLTEFVIVTVQSKADEIVAKHRTFLATKNDEDVFFYAIMNPPEPNKQLQTAMKKYKKQTDKK